jgi:undecaprenyl-diphosphatase
MLALLRRFEARVLIALSIGAAALWAFLTLGGEMAEGETMTFDRWVILALRTPGNPHNPVGSHSLEEAVRDVTALGGTTIITLVTVIAILVFLLHGRRRHALVMGGGVLLAWLSSETTKSFYDRPRPDIVPHEVYVYSGSFPSGHSTLSAATYLILATLIASLEPVRGAKALVYAVAVAVLVCVGASRVYLGVHWPSDVLAGWCLGALWALAAWFVLRRLGGQTRG